MSLLLGLLALTPPTTGSNLLLGNFSLLEPPSSISREIQTPGTPAAEAPSGFPTQYRGLFIRDDTGTVELCLVAQSDYATGMGGAPFIRKNGTTYAIYLVDTGDANASHARFRTTTGVKAIRLKT